MPFLACSISQLKNLLNVDMIAPEAVRSSSEKSLERHTKANVRIVKTGYIMYDFAVTTSAGVDRCFLSRLLSVTDPIAYPLDSKMLRMLAFLYWNLNF